MMRLIPVNSQADPTPHRLTGCMIDCMADRREIVIVDRRERVEHRVTHFMQVPRLVRLARLLLKVDERVGGRAARDLQAGVRMLERSGLLRLVGDDVVDVAHGAPMRATCLRRTLVADAQLISDRLVRLEARQRLMRSPSSFLGAASLI